MMENMEIEWETYLYMVDTGEVLRQADKTIILNEYYESQGWSKWEERWGEFLGLAYVVYYNDVDGTGTFAKLYRVYQSKDLR